MGTEPVPSSRYVAFLRAINVGGHTVKMDRLRALFEEMGFAGAKTFIASGNVVFDTSGTDVDALEREIERHLERALGFPVGTFIRSIEEVEGVAGYEPFPERGGGSGGHTLSVAFLKAAPADEVAERVVALSTEIDDLHVHGRELYWLRHTRIDESSITGAQLEKALAGPATMRNVTTVRRLVGKFSGS